MFFTTYSTILRSSSLNFTISKIEFPTLFLEKYFLENIILFPTDLPTDPHKEIKLSVILLIKLVSPNRQSGKCFDPQDVIPHVIIETTDFDQNFEHI